MVKEPTLADDTTVGEDGAPGTVSASCDPTLTDDEAVGKDGAPGEGGWVMEEQATANATAGPSTA
jgi:hypothetical protein